MKLSSNTHSRTHFFFFVRKSCFATLLFVNVLELWEAIFFLHCDLFSNDVSWRMLWRRWRTLKIHCRWVHFVLQILASPIVQHLKRLTWLKKFIISPNFRIKRIYNFSFWHVFPTRVAACKPKFLKSSHACKMRVIKNKWHWNAARFSHWNLNGWECSRANKFFFCGAKYISHSTLNEKALA